MNLPHHGWARCALLCLLLAGIPAVASAEEGARVPIRASDEQDTPQADPPRDTVAKAGEPVRVVPPKLGPVTAADEDGATRVSYSVALQDIRDGKADSVVKRYGPSLVTYYVKLRDGSTVQAIPAVSGEMDKAAAAAGVELSVEDGDWFRHTVQAVNLCSSVLFFFAMVYLSFRLAAKFASSPARAVRYRRGERRTTFADVAGQDEAKAELQEMVEFLRKPRLYDNLGSDMPKGALLEGPPGNGKTMLARAVADAAGAGFMHLSGTDLLEMFAGLGARRVRKTFAKARRKRGGCVVFIDEIDAVGGARGRGTGGDVQQEREHILNQLLVEMDGVDRGGRIVVVGATNRAEMLDAALVRAGRLDRRIHVPDPDLRGREALLRIRCRRMPLAADVSLHRVAMSATGFSGADTVNLANEPSIAAGRAGKRVVDAASFDAALDRILMGVARPAASVDPADRKVSAYHEAGHALVSIRSPDADPVRKVTLEPRGRALGMVSSLPSREMLLHSKGFLVTKLRIYMAGRAAEAIVFGQDSITSGAAADISEATKIARLMDGSLGMSAELGTMDYLGAPDGSGRSSSLSMAEVDREVRKRIGTALSEAAEMISREKAGLDALAAALLERNTLSGEEARLVLDAASRAAWPAGPGLSEPEGHLGCREQ